ncbi:MAG: UDP-N-acetylmuramoyl-tripeptide--D-alanyl-D-alanine ligase [Flavobacteriales bacterium]|nr:MAG: UDP-N-acetylmuramoyl-tripeptide--D-alanyl-D-alanine ligase [Flavobacteriales bacterium]
MITTNDLHKHFLECSGACTDTRQLVQGGLFFALKGPNFDANTMAAAALQGGCRYAVVDDLQVATDDRFILVSDVLSALQELARHHRRTFSIPVIAITGSNGKTTTKELVHAVLGAYAPALATSGNLNNHIGVPLTLLRMSAEHRFAIVEMGANKPGDIAELMAIAEPSHGMITNIGKAHLEGFGGYDGVVRTKTEMYAWIKGHGGTLFVHGDDELLMAKSAGIARITYGTQDGNNTTGRDSGGAGAFVSFSFDVRNEHGHYDVPTQLIGNYNVPNLLAAVCIGQHFGVPDEVIAGALAEYTPSNNRSQFKDTGSNHLVLDAYNANPSSMQAALRNFAALPSDRPKLVVLGDMLELGAESADEHNGIVALLTELQLKAWLVGPEFGRTGPGRVHLRFANATEALAHATAAPVENHLILVKGSRGVKLETLVPAF